jgi:3-deoxy-D-manno-octulosonic-acid transferase
MDLLYSLLVTIAAAVAAPWYLVRYGGRRSPRGYWRERMGLLPKQQQRQTDSAQGAIWIHAVSVGETLAVAGLVAEMRKCFPERPVYLSHVTPTGRAAGEARIQGVEGRFFLPLDWKWAARRTFDRMRPAMLIIAETELWPNLLSVARERGTRVILVNARLSERSLRGYRRFGFFFRRALAAIDHVFAQTERDAGRFRELGVPAQRITMAGNLKSDVRTPQSGDLARRVRRSFAESGRGAALVLVAGSTMRGEERLVLGAWDAIRRRFPEAFLVLAPRHPERFEEVAQLLGDEGRHFVRRTSLDPVDCRQLAEAEVLLLNTIGELAGVYEVADAAFVGGSLVPTGGHNPLEPALWAKPVLFGPHMDSFRDIAEQFVASGAAFQITSAGELGGRVIELFADPNLRQAMGSQAAAVLRESAGATARVLDCLAPWFEQGNAAQPAFDGSAR